MPFLPSEGTLGNVMVNGKVKHIILYRYLPSLWAQQPIPDKLREFWYTQRPDILKYMKKNYSQLDIDFEPNRILEEMYNKSKSKEELKQLPEEHSKGIRGVFEKITGNEKIIAVYPEPDQVLDLNTAKDTRMVSNLVPGQDNIVQSQMNNSKDLFNHNTDSVPWYHEEKIEPILGPLPEDWKLSFWKPAPMKEIFLDPVTNIKQFSSVLICDISSSSHHSLDHFVSDSNDLISELLN